VSITPPTTVYMLYGADERLLYVGITGNLRSRSCLNHILVVCFRSVWGRVPRGGEAFPKWPSGHPSKRF